MNSKLYYTGVGSRKTPVYFLKLITMIAERLRKQNYILRSGGALGADVAFESGAGKQKEIWYAKDTTKEAMEIAAYYHPAWEHCSDYAKALHGRNTFQVLGFNLKTPSLCLICWTPDGAIKHGERTRKTGGTGTAISIASDWGIPVFNLARKGDFTRLKYYMSWI